MTNLQNSPVDFIHATAAAAILPPRRVRLSEWAEQHYRLSSESSAIPGPFTCFEYQREPLDAMGPDSDYSQVVLVWASQTGKTNLTLAAICHMIAENPGPALCVQPTLSMSEAFSKERLAPMLRDCPILRGKVAESKGRDSGSTIFSRRFAGGRLSIATSNSPAGLASRPIRFLLLDEVDRFEASAGSEGDPVDLARARTRSFWNRKIVLTSSPTTKGASRIEAAWLESDQREFEVPCPHCGSYQVLTWGRVEYDENRLDETAYRCAHCEEMIPHHRKLWMLARGKWVARFPGRPVAGFHLGEIYSPWRSWGEMAADWLKAQGYPERLRSFINTSLAEWWSDEAAGAVKEDELMARRENYGPALPERVALLTAGVDIQADRAEVSLYGWGAGEESWLLVHRIIPGDPSTPGLWNGLDSFLSERWNHPIIGPMPIHAACVDSGAFTGMVTRFCDERRGRRVMAIKAAPGIRPVWPRRESKAPKGRVWVIGIDALRQTITQRLRIEKGPGRIHFPVSVGREFFEQLNSEFVRTEYRRGRPLRVWERRKGRRAEVWDCSNYALAGLYALAAHGIHVDLEAKRIASRHEDGYNSTYRSKFVTSR